MFINGKLTEEIIGAAIEVHKQLGPGLLESIYETCLCHEFVLIELQYERQKPVSIEYKGKILQCGYRIDLVVEDKKSDLRDKKYGNNSFGT